MQDTYFWLGDGPELETYKELAHDLGIEERVRFLGWRNDRAALLGAVDICVLPSRYEPFGTVIAEAWSTQVPLVAAKAAGALQYVIHGENGLLCAIDNPADLARQIRTVIADSNLHTHLIEGGKKTYDELFSRDVVIRTLINAYNQIISTSQTALAA